MRIAGDVEVEISTKQDAQTLLTDFTRTIEQALALSDFTIPGGTWSVRLMFEGVKNP